MNHLKHTIELTDTITNIILFDVTSITAFLSFSF